MSFDARYDIMISLDVDLSPEQMFKGWTSPDTYSKWFCPEPWTVAEARANFVPGGEFYTVMQSPEGDKFPGMGCVLEVIPDKKLVWTSALGPEYRPAKQTSEHDLPFTAILTFEAKDNGTLFTAIARHGSEEARQKHEDMGFKDGWTTVAKQLEKFIKSL